MKFKVGDKIRIVRKLKTYSDNIRSLQNVNRYLIIRKINHCPLKLKSCQGCDHLSYQFNNMDDEWCGSDITRDAKLWVFRIDKPKIFQLRK